MRDIVARRHVAAGDLGSGANTWLTFPQKLHPYALRNHTNTWREIRILHTGGYWLKFAEVSTRDVGYCYIPGVISLSLRTTCYSVEKSHFIQTQWISTCVEFDASLTMNRTMYLMYLLCTIGDVGWLIGIDGAPGFMTYSRGEWNLGNTIDLWESWILMPKDFFSTSGWLGSSLLSFLTWSGLPFITGIQGFVKLSLRERLAIAIRWEIMLWFAQCRPMYTILVIGRVWGFPCKRIRRTLGRLIF